MKRIPSVLVIAIVLLLWALSHFYNKAIEAKSTLQGLQQQIVSLEQENRHLKMQIRACGSKCDALEAQGNLSEAKQRELTTAQETYARLSQEMKKDIDQGKVQISRLSDQLSLTLVEQILFPSGGARLTPEGIRLLGEVAERLKETPNKIIRVIGHTDHLPPTMRLQSKFADNWALSSARAIHVVRILEQRGIDAKRLQAVGMGASCPVDDNTSPQGRSKNRRIELVLANPEASEK